MPGRFPSRAEFVALMALMMAMVALSIDAMLPALSQIGESLNVATENDRQLVLSVLFVGMAIGQLLYGPVSDSVGRKPVILFGMAVFGIGCLISAFSTSFAMMLLGRFLQGLGVAAPRTLTVAIVRDCYTGNPMAQILSLIMAVFILVPMLAPALGQVILWIADWRAIFYAFLILAFAVQVWFSWGLTETLKQEHRRPFQAKVVGSAFLEVLRSRQAVRYTLAASLVSGAFTAYLLTAQQIVQELYATGDRFPLYFAIASTSLGLASLANARMVMKFGMLKLTQWSLLLLTVTSALFLGLSFYFEGVPPLQYFMIYLLIALFPVGALFGNLNALAMEPLGHVAGMAAAVIGSVVTLVSVAFGAGIGYLYDNTVLPLVAGFMLMPGFTLLLVEWGKGSHYGVAR